MKATRKIQTKVSHDGVLIFRLLQGAQKLRTIKVFGYNIKHDHWVQILGFNTSTRTTIHQPGNEAKLQIAAWSKN